MPVTSFDASGSSVVTDTTSCDTPVWCMSVIASRTGRSGVMSTSGDIASPFAASTSPATGPSARRNPMWNIHASV